MAGFRADLSRSVKDNFVLEGNVFRTDGGQTIMLKGLAAFGVMGR